MALKTASTPKRAAPKQSPKKSPKKLTLLDLIDIDQLVNEHAEVVSTTTDTLEPNLLTDRIEPIRQIKCVQNKKELNDEEKMLQFALDNFLTDTLWGKSLLRGKIACNWIEWGTCEKKIVLSLTCLFALGNILCEDYLNLLCNVSLETSIARCDNMFAKKE